MNPPGFRSPWQKWAPFVAVMGTALVVSLISGWWVYRQDSAGRPPVEGARLLSIPITTGQAPEVIGLGQRVGNPPPDFTLPTLDGGQATLSALRSQQVLINFWASWCPPCRLEMPDLARAYEVHKAEVSSSWA